MCYPYFLNHENEFWLVFHDITNDFQLWKKNRKWVIDCDFCFHAEYPISKIVNMLILLHMKVNAQNLKNAFPLDAFLYVSLKSV